MERVAESRDSRAERECELLDLQIYGIGVSASLIKREEQASGGAERPASSGNEGGQTANCQGRRILHASNLHYGHPGLGLYYGAIFITVLSLRRTQHSLETPSVSR
jgi:hypothetical protein